MDYKRVGELIAEYIKLTEHSAEEKDKVYVKAELRKFVLTGEEIATKGVLETILKRVDVDFILKHSKEIGLIEEYKEQAEELRRNIEKEREESEETEEMRKMARGLADNYEKGFHDLSKEISYLKTFLAEKRGGLVEDVMRGIEEMEKVVLGAIELSKK